MKKLMISAAFAVGLFAASGASATEWVLYPDGSGGCWYGVDGDTVVDCPSVAPANMVKAEGKFADPKNFKLGEGMKGPAQLKSAGGGAGKASFQDLSIRAAPKIAPVKGESTD